MKKIRNIIPLVKLVFALRFLQRQKKEILKARAAGDMEREREYILKATTCWGKHLADIFNIKINVQGYENLPEKGPVVFVSNHQSYADIPVLCAVLDKFQFGFIAKSDLEKVPLYGWWIENIRSVYIKREDARASLKAINEGIDLIEKGFSMAVFPEGTRSRCSQMGEFKKGSLRLATKPEVPVVPIALNGTYEVFEKYGYVHSAEVDLVILPPVETAGLSKSEASELSVVIEDLISAELEKLPKR